MAKNSTTTSRPQTSSLVYQANRSEISEFFRDGDDLVIHMTNGGIARNDQFFARGGGQEMALLLQESNGSMCQAVFAQRGDATVMTAYTPFEPDAAMAASLSEAPLPLERAGADAKWNGYSVEILGFTDDIGVDQSENFPSETRTDDAEPLLHGVAKGMQPGDRIRIYEGEDFLGYAEVDADGTWSFAVPHRSDGFHVFSARILTAAGDESAFSGQFLIHVDTHSPVWPCWVLAGLGVAGLAVVIGSSGGSSSKGDTTDPAASATIDTFTDDVDPNTGDVLFMPIGDPQVTNDTTPILKGGLNGVLPVDEEVVIFRSGDGGANFIEAGTASVTDASWTYQETALADGEDTYKTVVRDAAGNRGEVESDLVTLIVDTGSPAPAAAATIVSSNDVLILQCAHQFRVGPCWRQWSGYGERCLGRNFKC